MHSDLDANWKVYLEVAKTANQKENYEKALSLAIAAYGAESLEAATVFEAFSRFYELQGDTKNAEIYFEKVLSILRFHAKKIPHLLEAVSSVAD